MGCSGDGSMPTLPGIGKSKGYYNPIDDMLRSFLWTTGTDDDVEIDDDSDKDKNVDIDIEPLGASFPRSTMVTWTYAQESGPKYTPINIEGTNTIRLANSQPYLSLVTANEVDARNALATVALKETDDKEGYMDWLNDEWSWENSTAVDVEVYAGDIFWNTSPSYNLWIDNFANISNGLSSWAVDQGYTYGPEIAIFDAGEAFSLWTDIYDDYIGTPPSIWGDASDL